MFFVIEKRVGMKIRAREEYDGEQLRLCIEINTYDLRELRLSSQ